jgi:LacI family transcriptional regulator, galactose operon repressor
MKKGRRIVLMIEPLGEYVQGLLRGVVRYSHDKGPWTFYREPGKHEGTLPQLEPSKADGIIAKIPNTPQARKKIPENIPAISVGYRKPIPGIPQIFGNSEAIGIMAAQYYLSKGFEHFGFCGFDEMHWSRERELSFKNTIEQAGFDCLPYENLKKSKRKLWQLEQQDIAKWLKALPKPVAILTCNDDRGQHVLSACKLAKLLVPDQVAVLGVDNDNFACGLSYIPLSSIALGTEKAGYAAAELLANLISKKTVFETTVMVNPTHVVTRQSTDILAVDDEVLAAAVKFIYKYADKETSVDDVVEHVGVSRRTLERSFRKKLNRSVYGEIRRIRVNRIIEMLLGTDLSITQIGLAMGFKDITHTGRYFKEETGLSPLVYRNNFTNKVI